MDARRFETTTESGHRFSLELARQTNGATLCTVAVTDTLQCRVASLQFLTLDEMLQEFLVGLRKVQSELAGGATLYDSEGCCIVTCRVRPHRRDYVYFDATYEVRTTRPSDDPPFDSRLGFEGLVFGCGHLVVHYTELDPAIRMLGTMLCGADSDGAGPSAAAAL